MWCRPGLPGADQKAVMLAVTTRDSVPRRGNEGSRDKHRPPHSNASTHKENEMKLKVKRLHPDAILPKYQTAGAACFDLHAVCDEGSKFVPPGSPEKFRTGLSFEVPAGHVMLIFSRSGHGFGLDTRLANCVGVIDSDYRGEVHVKLTRDSSENVTWLGVSTGDRIAQAMILPIPLVEIVEADGLSETARGANGFGSTGQ